MFYMHKRDLVLGVVLEERFYSLPDGSLYSPSGFGDKFWRRYLTVFDSCVIIARLTLVERAEVVWDRISDPRISIRGVSNFIGPLEFISNFFSVHRSFKHACVDIDVLIVRAPGTLSLFVLQLLRRPFAKRMPIGVELVGDPVDVFSSGVGGKLHILFKIIFKLATERLCKTADSVSYVTQFALQRRYAFRKGVLSIACSSIELAGSSISSKSRLIVWAEYTNRHPIAFTAASLEAPYKGINFLIEATAHLARLGFPLLVRIAGEGRLRTELEAMSQRLGVADRVSFLGRLDRNTVLDEMRRADLYIQPSLTEGLPRAVIEACATAAPIVASRVGGIPELLADEDMVPAGDPIKLAACIMSTLTDPDRMLAMSKRNLDTARGYSSEVLTARRESFYFELRRLATESVGN